MPIKDEKCYRNEYRKKIQFEANKKKKNDILPRKLWHHIA